MAKELAAETRIKLQNFLVTSCESAISLEEFCVLIRTVLCKAEQLQQQIAVECKGRAAIDTENFLENARNFEGIDIDHPMD